MLGQQRGHLAEHRDGLGSDHHARRTERDRGGGERLRRVAPAADRLGVPERLVEQQGDPRIDGAGRSRLGVAGPEGVGPGVGAPATRIASNSTDRAAANVRCTVTPSTGAPVGPITSGTMPPSKTARRTGLERRRRPDRPRCR